MVVRDRQGHVAHRAIGCAIVEADLDGGLTMFALRKGVEPLASFFADSPAQAEGAKRTLAELGDVEFDDRDFDPEWFEPTQAIEAIEGLLEHGRKGRRSLPEPVLVELGSLWRTLAEAVRRSCRFYLVEVEPGEDLEFAGAEFKGGAG